MVAIRIMLLLVVVCLGSAIWSASTPSQASDDSSASYRLEVEIEPIDKETTYRVFVTVKDLESGNQETGPELQLRAEETDSATAILKNGATVELQAGIAKARSGAEYTVSVSKGGQTFSETYGRIQLAF